MPLPKIEGNLYYQAVREQESSPKYQITGSHVRADA
jgi:hypothetical protein